MRDSTTSTTSAISDYIIINDYKKYLENYNSQAYKNYLKLSTEFNSYKNTILTDKNKKKNKFISANRYFTI